MGLERASTISDPVIEIQRQREISSRRRASQNQKSHFFAADSRPGLSLLLKAAEYKSFVRRPDRTYETLRMEANTLEGPIIEKYLSSRADSGERKLKITPTHEIP